jgi:iron complex transport system substrate-binding protein
VYVEVEWLLDQNPDVIIGSEHGLCGYETDDISSIKTYYEEIIGLPGFKEEMDAVKNGRVHIIDMSITRGCKNLVGTAYMAKWFYPNIPLDPIEIHQNYLGEFCGGLDYDVREHGVFVYPPLEES